MSRIETHIRLGRFAGHAVLCEKKAERWIGVIYQLEQVLVASDLLPEELHHFNPFLMILGDTGAVVAVAAESADVLATSINTGFFAKQI
jgi:hypothetical protein